MRAVAVLMALAATGCAAWDRRPGAQRWANRIGLAVMEAGVACDWGSTRNAAMRGWPGTLHEANELLGPRPSPSAVDLYMSWAALTLAVVHHAIPERWRPLLWVPVVAFQVDAVTYNVHQTGFCGVR